MMLRIVSIIVITAASYAAWSYGLPQPLILFLLIVVLIAAVPTIANIFGYRVRDDIRIMEVAAFIIFAIDILWITTRSDVNRVIVSIAKINSDLPLKPILVSVAVAYCASLLRLFFWEWYLEETPALRAVLRNAGVIYALIDTVSRFVCWFILLSFPMYLGNRDIPFPIMLGFLNDLPSYLGLLIMYLLFVAWDLLAYFKSQGEPRVKIFWWIWFDLISLLASFLMTWAYRYAEYKQFDFETAFWFHTAYTIAAGILFFVLVVDFFKSKYWEVFLTQ